VANRWEPEKAGPQDTPSLFYWCWRQFRRLSDYIEGITPPDGGEANTSSNKGTGVGLALPKEGVDLPFKSLEEGTGINITDTGEELVISSEGGGTGGGGAEIEQPNHGFAVLDAIRYDVDADEWVLALADDMDTLAVGIVVQVFSADRFLLAQTGEWTFTHGLAVGEYYWLSNIDPGKALREPPSVIEQPLWFTSADDLLWIMPYRPSMIESAIFGNLDGGRAGDIFEPGTDIDGGFA